MRALVTLALLYASPLLGEWFKPLEAGVRFEHRTGAEGAYFMPEVFGAGAALFDYDGDGDLDLYVLDGGRHGRTTLTSVEPTKSPAAPDAEPLARNRLWRQQPNGRFVDAGVGSGLDHAGYGMGVAVGDVDGDGLDDVFLANFGADALLRNRGDGRFVDVTAAAGLAGGGAPEWSAGALFFDFDDDGDLDLFVVHYLDYTPPLVCSDQLGRPDYCGPAAFAPTRDRLYRNDGGFFRDVTEASGVASAPGRGLGAVSGDFDGDGRLDLYVANDGQANQLWLQERPGHFTDRAAELGVAVNAVGRPEAGMGIAAGDVDGDGHEDLFVTHLRSETHTLYRAEPSLGFIDRTQASGLAAPSLPYTGFGAAFADLDLDADLDLVIAHGGVTRGPRPHGASGDRNGSPRRGMDLRDYEQRTLLFTNDGSGRFDAQEADPLTTVLGIGRAVVTGDLDDDGDVDLVLTAAGGALRLFENRLEERHPDRRWLQVTVRSQTGGVAEHARVSVECKGQRQVRQLRRAYGYQSSHDPRLSFGLGDDCPNAALDVRWRDGHVRRYAGLPANRRLVVTP